MRTDTLSSSSAVDANFLLTENLINVLIYVVAAVVVYLFTLQSCCGTMSLRKASAAYQRDKSIRARYASLFTTRDNLLYHISWSKSNGDIEDAKRLMRQLADLDKVFI